MIGKHLVSKTVQCHLDYEDPDTFVVGEIIDTNDKWMLMRDISPYGRYNGVALYLISDVLYIEEDTVYIGKLKKLIDKRYADKNYCGSIKSADILQFLEQVKFNSRIVCVELEKSGVRDIKGYVESIENSFAEILVVDDYGNYYGKAKIPLSSITRCFAEDDESVCLEWLSEHILKDKQN